MASSAKHGIVVTIDKHLEEYLDMTYTEERIFGHTWAAIQIAQQGGRLHRRPIDTRPAGDYGADPLGDGTFRMVPSGDIVDFAERCRRLSST